MLKETLRLAWFSVQVILWTFVISYLAVAAIMEPLEVICVYPCLVNGSKEVCRYCKRCRHMCPRYNDCRTVQRLSTSVKKHIRRYGL